MESELLDIQSQLRPVFEALDFEKSGWIETKRFVELAEEYFQGGSDHRSIQDLLSALDPNNTGLINFTAFCQGVESVILSRKGGGHGVEVPPSLSDDPRQITVADDDDTKSNGTSESTYNEYDDSALTDMSEGTSSPSPLISEAYIPNLEMDEGVEALMGLDFVPNTQSIPVPVIKGSEERYEDFGESDAGIEVEVTEASSISDSVETAVTDRQTPTNVLNGLVGYDGHKPFMSKKDVWSHVHQSHLLHRHKCPSKRLTSSDIASQLYRSSSSHNLPKSALDDVYGEYAASDGDVLELSDKVRDLETQITYLEVDKNNIEDTKEQLRNENQHLHKQVALLEDQVREMDRRNTENLEEESRKHQEKMTRQHKSYSEEIETLQNRISVLYQENESLAEEVPKLKSQAEAIRHERDKLEQKLLEVDNNWLALSSEYQRKQEEFRLTRANLEEVIHNNETIIDEMAKELEQLRSEGQSEIARHATLMRSPSIQDLPSRYSELQLEVQQLRKENKQLKESNDEYSAQILNNGIQIGRSLLHRGAAKSESFAAELETASKDDIMEALREEENMNRDLREYIGRILTKIIENHPGLLEIKPRSKSVSSIASFNSYS
ncbi:rab11 family-interacting protein 4-like [Diadema antillarum]|uniref:rab11 family-interacting protein 4-like n=1 Tax=Diadema antillarum TaxID=105358 RepID=UPI003A847CD5